MTVQGKYPAGTSVEGIRGTGIYKDDILQGLVLADGNPETGDIAGGLDYAAAGILEFRIAFPVGIAGVVKFPAESLETFHKLSPTLYHPGRPVYYLFLVADLFRIALRKGIRVSSVVISTFLPKASRHIFGSSL